MIEHIALNVSDYNKSKAFYLKALKPIGYHLVLEFENKVAGIGIGKKPYLVIHGNEKTIPCIHLAFHAKTRSIVDDFYKAGIEAGGVDNGSPDIREKYHPNYYAAFVLDPDGHNIEVVCHEPEEN